MIVYLNGKFLSARDAKISPFDPGFLYGDGIFETLRTYNGKLWQVPEHIERLMESAKMRGWKLPWRAVEIAEILETTLKRNSFKNSRVRVMVTPGVKSPTLFVWVQPMEAMPDSFYKKGVSVITFPLERPFPQMKTMSMQPLLIARNEMSRKKAYEVFLINTKGFITEASWANVCIVKKKTIMSPRTGVLMGTTRELVLKLARPLLHIRQQSFTRRQLLNADECFLTSSTKGIVPVVRADGEVIGTGRVGPVTKHLMEKFAKRISRT